MDVVEIEKHLADAIVQATNDICAYLALGPLGAPVLDTMQPYLHETAQAFVAAVEAGDTPEQFTARMAALNAEES